MVMGLVLEVSSEAVSYGCLVKMVIEFALNL